MIHVSLSRNATHKYKTHLLAKDNGIDAKTFPVNTSSFITVKDAFYCGVKLGKAIISFRTDVILSR